MKRFFLIVSVLIFSLTLFKCDFNGEEDPENPVPVLSSISPDSKVSHLPSFTLTAAGSNFVSGSQIVFNGNVKQTTFVSTTEISCQIDPDDITLSTSSTQIQKTGDVSSANSSSVPVLVRNPSPGGGDSGSINFTIQDDHTFYLPTVISPAGSSYHPDIAADSEGNVNVVWAYWDNCPNTNVPINLLYFIRSTDGGSTWNQPVISVDASPMWVSRPAIAVDSTRNINVVYEFEGLDHFIYFCQSTDNGILWSQPVRITDDGCFTPAIGVDGSGYINVVWAMYVIVDLDILFSRSETSGSSWSNLENISGSSSLSVSSAYPDIAVDSAGNLNVVWEEYALSYPNNEIFFSRSETNGTSWNQAVNLSNTPAGGSRNPRIAIDNAGDLNVVWSDEMPEPGIFLKRSEDNGNSWDQSVVIPNSDGSYPAVAVDSAGNINVVWKGMATCNFDIFFARSTDDGVTWSEAINISNSADGSCDPKIAVDTLGDIYIVWYSQDNRVIYFTSSVQ